MQAGRPTQKKIAALAGLHVSTVCLALRNHPALAEGTRQRVREIAERLGYRPDPMLSALAAYRQSMRRPAFQGELAWLSASTRTYQWRQVPVAAAYMQAAAKQAARHGYKLLDFDLQQDGMNSRRVAQILLARNIRGLLVCPQPEPEARIDFPWEHFSAVALGHTLTQPALHTVAPNHFHSTQIIFRRLQELGYRRIGLALHRDLDERVGGHFLGAFLREQSALPAARRIPPFLSPSPVPSQKDFARWLRRSRPDALITLNYVFPELLDRLKVKIPEDLGVAVLFRKTAGDDFAGIDQNARLTGAIAMDYLTAMILRREQGVPAFAHRVLVEGRWVAGKTVRPRA